MNTMKVLVVAFAVVAVSNGLPTGPPPGACDRMEPTPHGPSILTTINYDIVAPPNFRPGAAVPVSIGGMGGTNMYKGLLLQVRSISRSNTGRDIVGFWSTPPNNYKLYACNGSPSAGISHSNNVLKMTGGATVFTWNPQFSCQHLRVYYIRATVVGMAANQYNANIEKPILCLNPPQTTPPPVMVSSPMTTMPPTTTTTTMAPTTTTMAPTTTTMAPTTTTMAPTTTTMAPPSGGVSGVNMPSGGIMVPMPMESGSSGQGMMTTGNMMDRHANAAFMESIKPSDRNLYCSSKWAVIPKGFSTSFEGGLGAWQNILSPPNPQIVLGKGSTPTLGTGPTMAQDGDYYVHYEGTGQRYLAKAALRSPMGLKGCFCFSFYYHMNTGGDANIGIGINNVVVGRVFGVQNRWVKKSIAFTTCDQPISVFLGVTGGRGDKSDIAFDSLVFKPGPCAGNAIRFYLSCNRY